MDIGNITKLLPEFLEILGKNGNMVEELLENSGLSFLEKGGKYAKYLPLLPLLSNISKEGLSGLLNDTEGVKTALELFSQSNSKYAALLRGIEPESIVKYLPLLSSILSKKGENSSPQTLSALPATKTVSVKRADYSNPLSPLAGIADKEILYALNSYISTDVSE